jgi:hypothetical protein
MEIAYIKLPSIEAKSPIPLRLTSYIPPFFFFKPLFLIFAMKSIIIALALAVSSVSAIQINFVNNCAEREIALPLVLSCCSSLYV